MANNRIYMHCTVCKQSFSIAKYYPDNWSFKSSELMDEFMRQHEHDFDRNEGPMHVVFEYE